MESDERFAHLLLAELTGTGSDASVQEILTSFDDAAMVLGTRTVLRNILDHITDFEIEDHARGTFADVCHASVERLLAREDTSGTLFAGLASLVSLTASLLDRRFESPDAAEQDRADTRCVAYFERCAIGRAIELIYAPDGPIEARFWSELDFTTFRYHKAGTTSFILRGTKKLPDNEAGHRLPLALKCVLFPWNKVAAIARSTDEYAVTYGSGEISPLVVQPIASSGMWVLMPFQPGPTLGEHLARLRERLPASPVAGRITEAARIAQKLTEALHQLAGREVVDGSDPRRQHLDLSPNNIIFEQGTEQVRFIDLGINHLYSRQVGISEHDDAVYIAPEIKNHRGTSPTADVYSLGIILMEVLTGSPPRDGRTPDEIWAASPILGQTLEDLIEEHPGNRLLRLSPGGNVSFADLCEHLRFCFELVAEEPVAAKRRSAYLWALVAPTSREFSTQFKQWGVWRREHDDAQGHDRYLLFFSAVSTLAWWFIAAKTALVKLDDAATGNARQLPQGMELYANIIAFCQGLVAAKFYQTMLARLTVRGIPGFKARCTEVMMRSMAVVAVPTTILSTFSPSMYWIWPWTCAVGALAVAACNFFTYSTARALLIRGERVLSTTPEPSQRFARGYEQWWWTMLLYTLIIAIVGFGIQVGALKDVGAYVFILVVISVGVHYGAKCASAGPAIRGSVARAFSIGQRVEIVQSKSSLKELIVLPSPESLKET